jgi:hypothetical protein
MQHQIKTIHEPAREIPVRTSVDILIVGGGPTGIMAAEAAAGKGLKVMLIESKSFLGGNMVMGLPLLGFLGRKGNPIIKGLPQKFVDRLAEQHATSGHRACPLHVSLTMIEPEASKLLALQLMEEAGVEVLMYVTCVDTIMEGKTVKGVIIESKAGREAILAKTIIDCTGDGDVAYRAGAAYEVGNSDGRTQPPTLMFCMKGVDVKKLRESVADHPELYDIDYIPNEFFRKDANFTMVGMRALMDKARAEGLNLPVSRTVIMTGIAKDEMWINMSRVNGVDATDPVSCTYGEIQARKQNEDVVKYLIKYVPGFENSWMEKVAPYLGIRETRRFIGEYMLTDQDILDCRRFDDAVLVASYPVDLHHPVGGDCTLYWCEDCYDIPYRCFVPKGIHNLLVAGRCASMTHEAMASTRVMGTCMAMGEAVGKAAQVALLQGVAPADVDVKKVQQELLAEGAYLRV